MIREHKTLDVWVGTPCFDFVLSQNPTHLFLHKDVSTWTNRWYKLHLEYRYFISSQLGSLQVMEDFDLHMRNMTKFRKGGKSLFLPKVHRVYECFIKRFVNANQMSYKYYTVIFLAEEYCSYYHRLDYWGSA